MCRPWVSGLMAHVQLWCRAGACTSLQLTGRLVQQRPRRCPNRQLVERRGRVGSSPRKSTLQALWACGLAITSGSLSALLQPPIGQQPDSASLSAALGLLAETATGGRIKTNTKPLMVPFLALNGRNPNLTTRPKHGHASTFMFILYFDRGYNL